MPRFIRSLFVAWLALLSLPLVQAVQGQGTATGSMPKIEPPLMQGDKQEISLPGTIDEIAVGGGGRYLVFLSKSLGKIGVFDVNQLKIVGYIPAADADTAFAVGATKVIVISNGSGVIARWDLATQMRELTQSIDVGAAVKVALMGSASPGPAFIGTADSYSTKMSQVDVETLKVTPFTPESNRHSSGNNFRISVEGNVIGMWASGLSPSGLNTFVKSGDKWTGYNEHTSAGSIVPSPTGKYVYTAIGIYTNQLRRLGANPTHRERPEYFIPAAHGPYYLSVETERRGSRDKKADVVSLKLEGDERALATIPNVADVAEEGDEWARQTLTLDKRMFFIPDANLIVKVASTKDKFIAVRFDVNQALQNSDVNYLLITSRPPLSIKAGEKLSYPLVVKSKGGGVTYSLDSAPEGMQISPTGVLAWTTTTKSPANSKIIITVSDKTGQQAFHTFSLMVSGGDANPTQPASTTAPAPMGTAKLLATTPLDAKEGAKSIPLPGTITDVVVGGNGRFLLCYLRELKKIAVFDVSQAKIVGYLPAADDDTKVVAGATRALVFSISQGVVARYRLDTLQREVSTTIPTPDSIQYAGMGAGTEGPVLIRTAKGTGQLDSATLQFLDLNTLKMLPVTWPNGQAPHAVFRDMHVIRVATNGSVYAVQGIGGFRLNGGAIQYLTGGDRFGGGGGNSLPAADGSHFLSNGQLQNADQKAIGDQSTNFGVAIPSVTGRYFLSFKAQDFHRGSSDKQSLKLYMFGDSRPLVTLNDVPVSISSNSNYSPNFLGWDKRIFFVPDAHALVTLPASNDRIELQRLNIDEALEASGVDYLVVDSQAPATAETGKTYAYAIKVKSKKGGVKFGLDAAPPEMKIAADGKLNWPVPKDLADEKVNVVVSVGDASGQSTYHTFAIEIPENKVKAAEAKRQREEQLRLAQEQQRLAQAEARKQETERRNAERVAAMQRQKEAAEQAVVKPVMRIWTDSSGEHKLTAKFVEVLERKTVVLQLDTGETRKIPLNRLSEADIYEAVKNDLLSQGIKASPQSPFSP